MNYKNSGVNIDKGNQFVNIDFDLSDSDSEEQQKCRRYYQSDGNFCK